MNYSFISVFLPILIAGILIHKLLEAKISRIIQRQKGVVTTKSGEDVLRDIFGEDVKIKRLEKSKGLGGETYDPDQEEFSLTEEIGSNNTAAKTIGYLLTIERFNRRSYGTAFIIGRVLQAFLTLLALVYLPILFF